MIVALKLTLGLLLAAAPVAVSAQAVTDIKFGQTLTKKAGTKTDIYRFVGGSGTTIKATLTAPGEAALILYTPAGEEMLTAQGAGSVTLEAILPLWDVFLISVLRADGDKPYTLKLTGDEPDALFATFAYGAGYEVVLRSNGAKDLSSCWVDPGHTFRATGAASGRIPGVTVDSTIGRGTKWSGIVRAPDGKVITTYESEAQIVGEKVIVTSTLQGGSPSKDEYGLIDRTAGTAFRLGSYNRYQCD